MIKIINRTENVYKEDYGESIISTFIYETIFIQQFIRNIFIAVLYK